MLTTTIAMISDTVARDRQLRYLPGLQPPYDDAVAFVLGGLLTMPRAMSLALRCATLLFLFSGVWYGGRLFSRNSPEARAAQWANWRNHPFLGSFRDFVRFYESLAMMALYSRPEAARKIA